MTGTDTTTAPGGGNPPLAYHRLAHLDPRTGRWWRPFAAVGVGVGLLLALAVCGLLTAVVVVVTETWVALPAALTPSADLEDPRDPMDFVLNLGLIALLIPLVVLALRWGGGQRGTVHSVAGHFRWGLALRAGAVVLPAYAVVLWTWTALAPPEDLSVPPLDLSLLVVVAVVLLLTPLQCAAEEYAFRGLPMQLFMTWLRAPVVGIVLPVPLFMLGHGYDWVGQVDIAVFALCMGFLVWKSGGLELAVVAHTANNLPLFLAAPLSPSSLQQRHRPVGAARLAPAHTGHHRGTHRVDLPHPRNRPAGTGEEFWQSSERELDPSGRGASVCVTGAGSRDSRVGRSTRRDRRNP